MLTHKGTQTIRTNRLTLRRFTEKDTEAMYQNWASDPSVTEFLRWKAHCDISVTQCVLKGWLDLYKQQGYYQWAIVADEIGEPIGCIGAVGGDAETLTVHIGYALGKPWWHQGYMTEALSAVIDFFFSEVNVNRIESQHDPDNPHSGDVMKKCAMTYEGTMRQGDFNCRGIVDACLYSILKEEWETNREIRFYRALPFHFNGFLDLPPLTDGNITLVCIEKKPAIPEKKYVPSYAFDIKKDGQNIGGINLRIGYSGFDPDESSLYYGGQIGYHIDEAFRGNGYAGAACRLVCHVAKLHSMKKLLITNDVQNTASRRVCEKLGLRHVRLVKLPEWYDLYKGGMRYLNIYEMDVE